MPTYDYKCDACGHDWELYQSMNDSPQKNAQNVKNKAKRLLGLGAGIIFKGSGFYETDYKTKSGKKKKRTQVLENHLILQNLQKIKVQTTKKTPLQNKK